MSDAVHHPSHYTAVVPGVECIEVTEHFGFLRGNAIKYLWRAGAKGDAVTDLEKARWYIDRELANLRAAQAPVEVAPAVEPEWATGDEVIDAAGRAFERRASDFRNSRAYPWYDAEGDWVSDTQLVRPLRRVAA